MGYRDRRDYFRGGPVPALAATSIASHSWAPLRGNVDQRLKLNRPPRSTICTSSGMGSSLSVRVPSGRQTCLAQTVTLLAPGEVEALPTRHGA
jgi:hypothetical protein